MSKFMVEVKKFEELSEELQEKVLERYRDFNKDIWDIEAKEDAKYLGIRIVEYDIHRRICKVECDDSVIGNIIKEHSDEEHPLRVMVKEYLENANMIHTFYPDEYRQLMEDGCTSLEAKNEIIADTNYIKHLKKSLARYYLNELKIDFDYYFSDECLTSMFNESFEFSANGKIFNLSDFTWNEGVYNA